MVVCLYLNLQELIIVNGIAVVVNRVVRLFDILAMLLGMASGIILKALIYPYSQRMTFSCAIVRMMLAITHKRIWVSGKAGNRLLCDLRADISLPGA